MSPALLKTDSQSTTAESIRSIDLSYDHSNSDASARSLVYALSPDWETSEGPVVFESFKDGITNTLFKAMKMRPGLSQHQIDEEAVLLRAYGNNTSVLIDREREARSHSLLASRGLAPPLLARFNNGLLYRYVHGVACTPADLRRDNVWPATARRLGQWHALLPTSECFGTAEDHKYEDINRILADKPIPNIWTVMRKWVDVLPSETQEQREQSKKLAEELEWSAKLLGNTAGLSHGQYVVSHCDLLSGNVIVHPRADGSTSSEEVGDVSFIDYEYATPSPAAFDLANHFAEWGGFELEYDVLPTKRQRHQFIREYAKSYLTHKAKSGSSANGNVVNGNGTTERDVPEEDVERLMSEVDAFRGMPGLYWGIWALIQALISQIDFDYASYAPLRLKEYWDWKAEIEGTRKKLGKEMPVREKRLAQEA